MRRENIGIDMRNDPYRSFINSFFVRACAINKLCTCTRKEIFQVLIT